MNKQIFFSYAWADRAIAMRIYEDLVRSNLNVWRDQINGLPNVDFQEEFLRKIAECDIFILLDSKNYRVHSQWCSMEIEHYFKCAETNPKKEIIVCLIQEDGEWRQSFGNKKVFEKLNGIKYFDFYPRGIYDNDMVYRSSINAICQLLGVTYTPWNVLPYERDFEDELAQWENKISDIERNALLKDYEIIRLRLSQKSPCIESRISNFIADCEFLQINSIFPYLTLGVVQSSPIENLVWKDSGASCIAPNAQMNKYRWEQCHETYLAIIERFPNDPRGYRGLAVTEYYLENNSLALTYYDKALSLMNRPENIKHKESIPEILQNQGEIYLGISDYSKALEKYAEALNIMRKRDILTAEIFLKIEFCHRMLENDSERIIIIDDGMKLFFNNAELQWQKGDYYIKTNKIEQAIYYFQISYQLESNLRTLFALARCYLFLENIKKFKECEKKTSSIIPQTEEDYYYLGYINYLSGNAKQAQEYYEKSNSYGQRYR